MWEETESPEKTHADVGRMCQLHIESGPGQKSIFFPHQDYNETTLNKTPLFKGLLFPILPPQPLLLGPWAWLQCGCPACQLCPGTSGAQQTGEDKSHRFNLLEMKGFYQENMWTTCL